MKQCPKCNQTYTDEDLNFCLNDGELLTQASAVSGSRPFDDSPPTVMMNDARVTNPSNWQAPPVPWHPQHAAQQNFAPHPMVMGPNQTLATVSLCLGIGSLTIGWCCSTGMLFAPAALITGFIALSQIKKDPSRTGGRGLALGGIWTGGAFLGIYILLILIYGVAIFFSAITGGH